MHKSGCSILLLLALVSASFAGEEARRAPEDYEEAVLAFNASHRTVRLLRLDGTVEEYKLPIPQGRYIPEGGIDVSFWGKVVYCGRWGGRSGRLEEMTGSGGKDNRARVYYAGFWSNAFENLDAEQLAISPDGGKLAFVATPRAPGTRHRPALFCMSLLTGRLVQVTSFKDVAARPKWSNAGRAVAFYLGTQRNLPADENAMSVYVAHTPLGDKARLEEMAPPVVPTGVASAKFPPAWADNDNVIYYDGRYAHGEDVGQHKVYRVRFGETGPEELAVGSRPVADAAGQIVAFAALPFGNGTYIVDDHRSRPRLLLSGEASARAVSASGKYLIAYCHDEAHGHHLAIVTTQDGKVVRVTERLGGHLRWIRIWKRTLKLFRDEE